MIDRSKISTSHLRLIVSSVGAAVLLAATVLTGLYLGGETQTRFTAIDTNWQAYSDEADRRGELLSRIRGHIGYGGIIHNFKNYVLRQDSAYLELLETQISDFTGTLEEYRKSGAESTELEHLAAIERTIRAYQERIPLAERAAREGWPPAHTDQLVKVDDTEAILSISALDAYWREKRQQTTRSIGEAVSEGNELVTVGFRFLAGLAIVAMLLYSLFFLLQRELRQSIAQVSAELKERKIAQQVAKKFQHAVDQSPATIIITDTESKIEYVNDKFCSLTGFRPSEVIGKTPKFLQSGDVSQEEYSILRQQLARGEPWHGTFRNRKSNGDLYWAKTAILPLRAKDGNITHFVGLGEDVTERQKAREHMHRVQKMEAVGLLASGVAHDFNNVLTTILGNVHLARLDAPEGTDFEEELEQIEIAAKRARNLVGQVLAFARRQPGEARPMRIMEVMQEVARLMKASSQPNIQIECDVGDETLSVNVDPTRLHQVIMNLCSNAVEAVGPEGGSILLSAESVQRTDGPRQVVVRVKDTGSGISEDIQARIFDPFFTTKKAGKGTGLGLSVVANLVGEMNGQIGLESAPGEGSTFTIELPAVACAPPDVAPPQKVIKGSGHILLIDDEREVLATCDKLLRSMNYDPHAFSDPVAALAAFEADPDKFALVMTDFVMPGMSGEELCRAIRRLKPDCPLIVYSAYQPGDTPLNTLQPIKFLEKPLEPAMLARALESMLWEPVSA